MKKSIIRVLTAALVVCGVGFISSCKDYDEELRVEIQNSGYIDGTLKEEINKEIEDLKEQKEDLSAVIDSLKKLNHCQCDIDKAIKDALAEYEKTHPDTDTDTNFITEQEWKDIQKAIDDAIKAALEEYEKTHPDTDTDTKPDYDKVQQMINDAIKDFKSCTCDPNANSCTCDPNKGNCTCDPNKGNCTCDPNKGNCTCDPNKVSCTCEVKTKAEIESMISKAITDALTAYYTSAQIDEMLKKYALKDDIADMATKAWVTEQISAIKACTTCEEAIKKINERIAEAEKTLAQHGDDIKALYEQYTKLELFIAEVNSLASRALQEAQNAQKAAEAAQSLAESAMTTAQHADQLAQEVADNLETLTNTVNLMGIKLAVLKERVEKINTRLLGVEEQMGEIYQKALDAYTQANKNKDDIQDIKNTYTLLSVHNALKDEHDALVGTVNSNYTELLGKINEKASKEELEKVEKDAAKNLADAKKLLQDNIDAVAADLAAAVDRIDVLETSVSDLQTLYATLEHDVTELKSRMDAAESAIEQNTKDIAQNTKDIEDLQKEILRIDALEKNLNSLVTSIEIQETSNPLFGSVNLPFGIKSNVLALWYGKALNDGTFPSYGKTAPYIWDTQALTSAEKSIAGAPKNGVYEYTSGDMLFDDSEGNAGTLYMTVNPSNVDFTGTTFSLVNSLDEESAFKLGALQPSDRLVQHGLTRSAANGFYEAPVTLSEADIYNVNLDVADGLLSSVKNVLSNVTNPSEINTSKLASTVKNQVEAMRTDALGLKAHCDDPDRSVYSQYALAGVAIKNPITYASFKDLNVKSVPGYERAISLINSVSKTVKSKVKFNIGGKLIDDINAIKIQHINIPDLTDAQKEKFRIDVTIDTTIIIDGLKYHLDLSETVNVPVKFTKDVNVPISIHKDVEVDMAGLTVQTPTIVVTTDIKNKDGKAELVVPVKDASDNVIGNAVVNLDDVEVSADATIAGGKITLDGTVVANLNYDGNQTITVDVDENVSTTVNIDRWFYFGDNGTDKKTVHIWVNRSYDYSDAIEDIWNTVQNSVGDINATMDQLQKIVDDANDLFDQINSVDKKIGDAVDQVADQLKSFIDRINNKIVSIINSANSRLQPILIGSDSQTRLLSRAITQPSRINSSIDLYATNYLGEVVAPAFKKHIAVTNVYKADGTVASNAKDLADAVNASADMNKVLEGKQIKVSVNGFQAGYIYELAFSALDYTGKQVTHKYYVRVK